jgi:hypothetical protein
MTEQHYNIIEYYENGTDAQKEKAKDWLEKLNKTYDDDLNRVGAAKLYMVLKALYPERGKYPTKRFIRDYLTRQHSNQVRKQNQSNKRDAIASIVAARPNQHLMVDYLYFFWEGDGIEDLRGKGPIDEEADDNTKQSKDNTTKVKQLFDDKNIQYRGALVCIDVFSKYAYVHKIKGNINSDKAWKAMDLMLKEANTKFGKFGLPRIIQTDKGSEFMKTFRDNFNEIMDYQKDKVNRIRNSRNPQRNLNKYKQYGLNADVLKESAKKKSYYFKHTFGYEGRSMAQSMVERLNKTIKHMIIKAYGKNYETKWHTILPKIVENYNTNYHSTIKTSPDKIIDMEPNSNEIDEIKSRIKKRAIKHGDIDPGVYKVGDYVRIKIFKANKLAPKFTFKGGLGKIVKDDFKTMFDGVFVIHSVRAGKESRQTTYRIVSNWTHESKIETISSGQLRAKSGKRIAINSDELKQYINDDYNIDDVPHYAEAAFGRNFTKHALSRVPQDEKGKPISEKAGKYEVEEILSERQRPGNPAITEYEVKWKDYDATTFEPLENIQDTAAYDAYQNSS